MALCFIYPPPPPLPKIQHLSFPGIFGELNMRECYLRAGIPYEDVLLSGVKFRSSRHVRPSDFTLWTFTFWLPVDVYKLWLFEKIAVKILAIMIYSEYSKNYYCVLLRCYNEDIKYVRNVQLEWGMQWREFLGWWWEFLDVWLTWLGKLA